MQQTKRLLMLCGHLALLAAWVIATSPAVAQAASEHPLLTIMEDELKLSMDKLVAQPDDVKPYFIQYSVSDQKMYGVSASLGALTGDTDRHMRQLDVSVRVGDYKLDNTHQIRGGFSGGFGFWGGWTLLPLDGDPLTTRHAIWLRTDEKFKSAVKRLAEVQANIAVKVEEEDQSDDFSKEKPVKHIGTWIEQSWDATRAEALVKKCSRRFRKYPEIYDSSVSISGTIVNTLTVNSEGSKLQHGQAYWRINIQASTIADDGMELSQYDSFEAFSFDGLPDEAEVLAAVDQVIDDVTSLRKAPIVEPYTGPAILLNRASGVFFHEIFGHRMEGHRQKDEEEGQTFAKKLNKKVLPEFLHIYDDPTIREFGDIALYGHYLYDDECVPTRRVHLVDKGILKTFLMSRSPARGITKSNGHGRRQAGMNVCSRMGNLIIDSEKKVPFHELREMLKAECKKQDKEFGLLFTDISGGFTNTQMWSPQAYKVLPIKVFKIYVDGRPDELVRGVDICGTPLTSFSGIIATANDPGVFNGYCGAESGSVPVSAISPSILVRQIEIERRQKAQDRPPILPPPIADEKS